MKIKIKNSGKQLVNYCLCYVDGYGSGLYKICGYDENEEIEDSLVSFDYSYLVSGKVKLELWKEAKEKTDFSLKNRNKFLACVQEAIDEVDNRLTQNQIEYNRYWNRVI